MRRIRRLLATALALSALAAVLAGAAGTPTRSGASLQADARQAGDLYY